MHLLNSKVETLTESEPFHTHHHYYYQYYCSYYNMYTHFHYQGLFLSCSSHQTSQSMSRSGQMWASLTSKRLLISLGLTAVNNDFSSNAPVFSDSIQRKLAQFNFLWAWPFSQKRSPIPNQEIKRYYTSRHPVFVSFSHVVYSLCAMCRQVCTSFFASVQFCSWVYQLDVVCTRVPPSVRVFARNIQALLSLSHG